VPAASVTLAVDAADAPALTGDGSVGSRSMMMHGSALSAGARQVVAKGTALAAEQLGVEVAEVQFQDGVYMAASTNRSVSMVELITCFGDRTPHPLDTTASVPSTQTFPSGAHVAEIELEAETGLCRVVAYVAVDDCGVVVNHALVEGQIQGGIMQGHGQVFGEGAVYDAEGQLVTGSFMDYAMPRADASHPLRVINQSVPSPNNLLGVKGVGEAGTTGALPCLANAVIDALGPLGVVALDLPCTPGRIWSVIAQARNP